MMEKVILVAVYVLLVVTLIVGAILMALDNTIGFIIVPIVLVYIFASFGTVKEDEIGAKFIFGKALMKLESGIYFALLGIVKIRKFNCTERQNELPSEPENIYDGDGIAPEGKFKPIRIKFGQARDDDDEKLSEDPYNIPMVTEVVPVVVWKITNVVTFVKTMRDVNNCLQILTDKTIAIFADDLSKITPARAMLELHNISDDLESDLKADIGLNRGIEIIDAYLKPFNFSHSLNKSVIGVSISKQEAKAVGHRAEGEKKKKIKEGEGSAVAEKEMLKAKAEMKEFLLRVEREDLEKTISLNIGEKAQFVLYTRMLQSAYENSQYSIIPGGELFSATAGLKEMLDKISGGGKK